MAKSPIIGITTYNRSETGAFSVQGAYVDAVQVAGGIPILLPPNQLDPSRILDVVDGLILSGGGDINPILYGDDFHPKVYSINAERDDFELALAKLALNTEIAVLGICRGMQMLNVASGGDLVLHVPDIYGIDVNHRNDTISSPIEHSIEIEPTSRLAEIMGTTKTSVVSWHHQAVQNIAPGWRSVAYAEDGLVEAIECEYHPWMVAVQWHPEMSPRSSVHSRIFQSFVQAAAVPVRNYRKSA